ncbi:MAG TPA: sigma-70 family RNA polymerase sigma factor [Polyangiaceae bacterium]|nr:sigma-70 family RNA polymerase sigma factor [Polyangiaceae bacterium]
MDRKPGDTPDGAEGVSGSPASAERLRAIVDAEYDFVWRSLRRLGVADRDVDDALQQVMLTLSRKLPLVRPGCERSFLFQTALRVAADRRRSEKRRREVVTDVVEDRADETPSVEMLMDLHRARSKLDEILDSMTLDLRAVFALFELDQMTLTEIAELLGVPRGTVASRLRRAREDFKTRARVYAQCPGDEKGKG